MRGSHVFRSKWNCKTFIYFFQFSNILDVCLSQGRLLTVNANESSPTLFPTRTVDNVKNGSEAGNRFINRFADLIVIFLSTVVENESDMYLDYWFQIGTK